MNKCGSQKGLFNPVPRLDTRGTHNIPVSTGSTRCLRSTFDPTSLASNKNRKVNGFVLHAHLRHSIGLLWSFLTLNHGVAQVSF